MTLVLAAALGLLLAYLVVRARKQAAPAVARDTTASIDAWVADVLELELAEGVLGLRSSTPEERRELSRSLRGEPDPDVVAKVEEKVRAVELEFVRYAHEQDAELAVRVRYEDGRAATTSKRIAWTEVPESVREDFERRSGTRVFRTWALPWSRVSAL